MVNRFALKELKRDIKILFPVIIQLSCALVLIIACVSSIISRFKYYTPFEKLLEQKGCVAVVGTVSNYNSDDLKNKLHNCKDVHMGYHLAAGQGIASPTVYDDYIMKAYPLEMSSGEWVVSDKDSEYSQIMVSENTGYNIGDIITTNLDCKFQVAGIFEESQKIIGFNNMAAKQCDYRLLYTEGEVNKEYVIISRSEAEKCKATCYPNGVAFIVYNNDITEDEETANSIILSEHGMVGSFPNERLRSNSKSYIYEQLYTLLPILICVSLLLFVSVISVNSISTVKRLRTYAIYRMCGLYCNKCTSISILKSMYISVTSIIICCVFWVIKSKYALFSTFIMNIGPIQIMCCVVFLALNTMISYMVCGFIIRKNELNHIIKEN